MLIVYQHYRKFLPGGLIRQISDEGGGIPRSGLPKIWTYLYSTAKNPVILGRQDQEMPNVMAGYGYGLPISRLYARYFGGDLQVISMEGYGKCSCFSSAFLCHLFCVLLILSSVGRMNSFEVKIVETILSIQLFLLLFYL